MRIDLYFADCKPRTFKPFCSGRHTAKIVGLGIRKAFSNGQYLEIECEVTEEGKNRGDRAWAIIRLADSIPDLLVRLFKAVGLEKAAAFTTAQLIGQPVGISVGGRVDLDGHNRPTIINFWRCIPRESAIKK